MRSRILTTVGRGSERPTRTRITSCSAATVSGASSRSARRSSGKRRLERFRPPAVRATEQRTPIPRVDISPKREGERVRRCLVEPLRIVDRNEDRLGAGEFPAGPWRSPSRARAGRSARRPDRPAGSAAASARRCGAGRKSSAASSTCANKSTSPANESDASTPAGRATSTRQPRSDARSTPACQTVVFPIPAGPRIAERSSSV